jgi:hypothetical protein
MCVSAEGEREPGGNVDGCDLEKRERDEPETETRHLSAEELRRMHAYWRAANYLSVGQIYLYDNPLLTEPLKRAHIKPRLLGHWGTTPGLNLLYVHLNRIIKEARPGPRWPTWTRRSTSASSGLDEELPA